MRVNGLNTAVADPLFGSAFDEAVLTPVKGSIPLKRYHSKPETAVLAIAV
ncbi:MAG: hypothetical protein AMXMBFR59_15790 [Rhodanobacteraceae bacterium]